MRLKISHLLLSIGIIIHIPHISASAQDLLAQSSLAANVLYEKVVQQQQAKILEMSHQFRITAYNVGKAYLDNLKTLVVANNLQNDSRMRDVAFTILRDYVHTNAKWAGSGYNDLVMNSKAGLGTDITLPKNSDGSIDQPKSQALLVTMIAETMLVFNDPEIEFTATGGWSSSAGKMKLSDFLVKHLKVRRETVDSWKIIGTTNLSALANAVASSILSAGR